MTAGTRIGCLVDLKAEGRQVGHLRLPYSSHESAYGWRPIPIVIVRNGEGPTVLVTGGIHGDEYEGQIALAVLIRSLQPSDVRGALIIMPSANTPACEAANRLSPLDRANLNRAFPGDPNGTPTQMIAHFIEEILLPGVDYVVDLHSGGSSLDYLPCVRARLSPDPGLAGRTRGLALAFGGRATVLFRPLQGEPRTFSAACERKGVIYINPETGGGNKVGLEALRVTVDGISRCLQHVGVTPRGSLPEGSQPRLLTLAGGKSLVCCDRDGLVRPFVDPGDDIGEGQLLARVHDLHRPWETPQDLMSPLAGMVICRRVPGLARLGDCLFEIGVDADL